MPYGMNMSGPADWAAQQQAKQSENFSRIISLMLGLSQHQTEQDWKQKEFGANERRYAQAQGQQAIENKRADAMFGLNKQNVETDNLRQAEDSKSRAEAARQTAIDRQTAEKDRVKNWAAMGEDRDFARQDRATTAKEKADKASVGAKAKLQLGRVTSKINSLTKEREAQRRQMQGATSKLFDDEKATAMRPYEDKIADLTEQISRWDSMSSVLARGETLEDSMFDEPAAPPAPPKADASFMGAVKGMGATIPPPAASPIDPAFMVEGKKAGLTAEQIAAKWQEYQAKYGRK